MRLLLVPVRAAALIALVLLCTGCGLGPLDATQAGGDRAEPVPLLTVLPSPGALRGPPAEAADAANLARAFTGDEDPGLTARIAGRDPAAAGIREWTNPTGGSMTAVVTVWDSHLVATGVGSDLAGMLLDRGGSAWTPDDIPGSRGARIDDPAGRELRLSYSVGPNSLYVRSTGTVPEATVTKTVRRLIQALRGETG